MRHVIVMTLTGSVGLMAIFVVDLLKPLYIAQLGAGNRGRIGYAGTVLFFLTPSASASPSPAQPSSPARSGPATGTRRGGSQPPAWC